MKANTPKSVVTLSIFWTAISVLAIMGSINLLKDPTGKTTGLDDLLLFLPVYDLVLPGILLLVFLGIIPLFLTLDILVVRSGKRFILPDQAWWSIGLLTSFSLIGWIATQAILVGFNPMIHPMSLVLALGAIILMMVKPTRGFFFH